jgi:hypothetical protein
MTVIAFAFEFESNSSRFKPLKSINETHLVVLVDGLFERCQKRGIWLLSLLCVLSFALGLSDSRYENPNLKAHYFVELRKYLRRKFAKIYA